MRSAHPLMNGAVSKRIRDRISFVQRYGIIVSQEIHDDRVVGRTLYFVVACSAFRGQRKWANCSLTRTASQFLVKATQGSRVFWCCDPALI